MIYNKKRKLNKLKVSLLLLMMVCFAGAAQAQQQNINVWMREGRTEIIENQAYTFCDSHGPAEASAALDDESGMRVNYWDKWYLSPEHYVHTFIAPSTSPYVKVTFNQYTAYDWSEDGDYQALPPLEPFNCKSIGKWSLRLNDDWLYVYEGTAVDESKLIGAYTGNSKQEFTIMAQGAMTFRFVSNDLFREEGWEAEVTAVKANEVVPQPPYMRRSTCGDAIELIPATLGATIYYTTSGSDPDPADPLTLTQVYDGTPITWGAGDLTVKAIAVVGEGTSVLDPVIAEVTFTDADRLPNINTASYTPGLVRLAGTNKVRITCPRVPSGLNETFVVYYTDGITATGEPTPSNYSMRLIFVNADFDLIDDDATTLNVHRSSTYEFVCTNPNAVFRAKVYGFTCQNLSSPVAGPLTFGNILVDDPVISFTTTNQTSGAGTATITCPFTAQTPVIYYTTDGSEPDPSHAGGNNPTQVYNGIFNVTAGATVKAKAVVALNGYNPSNTVSQMYVPTNASGEPQNGVFGSVVLLDDREDHSWSYYSDGDQPVHRLKPADVKISYFGYGDNTMTTDDISDAPTTFNGDVDAADVAVSADEDGNQFVYLKTLENAKADGTGNYPYTMIPNPFSKRPTYEGQGGGGTAPETYTVYLDWSASARRIVTYSYVNASGTTVNSGDITSDGYNTVIVKANTSITLTARRTNNNGSAATITARYNNASGQQIVQASSSSTAIDTQSAIVNGNSGESSDKYRGFYAWRVKRLSNGLSIQRADGSTVGENGIIDAEEPIEFVTTNAEGNEVEFEALWAQAYVTTGTTAMSTYSNSYERNFHVLTTNTDFVTDNLNFGYPATISSRYPDGTGNSSATISLSGTVQLEQDLKIENIGARAYTNNGAFFVNGHSLIVGRGIPTTNYLAYDVMGTNGASTNNDFSNTRIRLESGRYYRLRVLNGTYGGRFHADMTFGCDYDRAKAQSDPSYNQKLIMVPDSNRGLFFGNGGVLSNASNRKAATLDCFVKSGTFQSSQHNSTSGAYDVSFYIGTTSESNSYSGKRYLTVEGGVLASIAGGRGPKDSRDANDNPDPIYTEQYVDRNDTTATIRIKKDAIIHGGVYGGAASSPAWGHRKIIITGGTIDGWVVGGCNGDNAGYVGRGIGNSYIYVGGNAIIGGDRPMRIPDNDNGTWGGNVFGAGRGSYSTQTASMENSYIVIADNCDVLQSVYGGGNYGRIYEGEDHAANIAILGGTIHENVYGGANLANAQKVFIDMFAGTVEGNIYGGCNTNGTTNGDAEINIHNGTIGGSVFGGGLGGKTNVYDGTIMGSNTNITISGGTINNNVYGGGELGTVTGSTHVTISGGTMQNVYGAGLGTKYGEDDPWPTANANIGGSTNVTVSGGLVNQSVYGGGENGSVSFAPGGATSSNSSTVSISGGQVKGDVFGGGREGTTQGRTIVNVSGGTIDNNVYGGAYGQADKVYVAGPHTVNLMGNHAGGYPYIKGCVYGGSRLANDGQDLDLSDAEFNSSNETELSSVINFSGGRVKEHVYAAGFYGRCFGSCYVNIGSLAVQNSPYNTNDKEFYTSNVYVQGTVWAGGDWGTFAGTFGKATITGNTNVYLDGEGYDTESTVYTDENYMGIGSSVLGCGTSCDAGKADRHFVMRNYGKMIETGGSTESPVTGTTRDLYSAQLFTKVFIDASHISFKGQGKMNDLNVTEKYSLFEILDERTDKKGGVYLLNGSTMMLDAPATQLNNYTSGTCANTLVANPTCSKLLHDDLDGAYLDGNDIKVRGNNGSYIEVKYFTRDASDNIVDTLYGPVEGYTHMMTSTKTDEATCAYARPKYAKNSPIGTSYDNPSDGGFVSYDDYYNVYQENGTLVENGYEYELAYENHAPTSKNDTEYFRVWRYGGGTHYVEGVINVNQVGEIGDPNTADYLTVDVSIQLPAWRDKNAYYRFDRTGDVGSYYTLIDYGTDVLTYNAASEGTIPGSNNWMFFNSDADAQVTGAGSAACPEIHMLAQNPDQNFGLIIMPGTAMKSADENNANYIICSSSDSYIAENMQYNCKDYMKMPTVTFRLTYKNSLSSNTTWDPVTIPLVQCLEDGTPKETVYITLTVSTETVIESTFNTQLYATMQGEGTSKHKRLQGTIVLPTFDTDVHPAEAMFYVESAKFTQGTVVNEHGTPLDPQTGSVSYNAHTADMDINSFGLTVVAVPTPDIMDDWRKVQPEFDCGPLSNGTPKTWNYEIIDPGHDFGQGFLGYAGGRNGLSIGFNLYYSDFPSVTEETLMGTLEIGVKFTHYAGGEGTDKVGHFKVLVQVYRRGEGANFYVDGIHGTDDTQEGRGKFPNYAAKSVEFVLSRLGYKPGDNIFVVNTVSINKPLKWDGSKKQDDVNIWRYPGNHPLKSDAGDIVGNSLNNAFTGVLFNVNKKLTLTSIKVDGIYHEANATTHRPLIFPTTPNPAGSDIFDGKADAPLFVVNAGGELHLRNVTKLLYNYNGNAGTGENATLGGAVWVKKDGLMTMNETANIQGNINANGGGVYMDGGMVVSNDAYVFNNFKAPASAKATQEQSNVWLTKGDDQDMYKVVQIGLVDDQAYNKLLSSAKIGIDKEYSNDAYKMDDYLPVVYTAPSTIDYLEEPYNANRANAGEGIIVHDKAKYKLEKYTPNNYLYWLSTWVTFQDHEPNHSIVDGVDEGGWDDVGNIHTPQQLAWFISLVNGENGATASTFAGETIKITDDISMDGHVWVPIGTPTHPFKGTFEGNGHVITDMYGSLVQANMGMFGYTDRATIQDAVMSTRFTGTNDNLGTVVGTMNSGTLSNVEGAGSITNKYTEGNMGGLVGNNVGGTIHSSFAVADMTGGANMGGLVGKNTGNLYNAYSNVKFAKAEGQTANMTVGGLAYENAGIIENCYVIEGSHSGGTFNAFAAKNSGNINFCYAADGTTNYVGSGTQPTTHGTYDVVKERKELGYLYDDNKVEKVGSDANAYITEKDSIYYDGAKILKWRGLVSTLNQWVAGHSGYTPWFRPTSGDINGDLPVLGFPKDNSLATEDGKFLFYGSNVNFNGLDTLFTTFSDKDADMFLYGVAKDVTSGNGNNMLYINEDAVLLQALAEDATTMADIKATVGVTFDNSSKKAVATNSGAVLEYDWHFMSSVLKNAPINAVYGGTPGGYLGQANITEIDDNSYFPNGLIGQSDVKWDFYAYSEKQYHWINLKRDDHFYQNSGDTLQYANEDQFIPGKGYMMAISKDSYMSSTGKLNTGGEEVVLTNQEDLGDRVYNKGWNLVGNPYQAYLDLSKIPDRDGGFYIFDADQKVYAPVVAGQSQNESIPSTVIHPHQAFFMHTSEKSETFTFSYDWATDEKDEDGASYYRGGDRVNYPLVNLFAENERGNRDMVVVELNRPELGGATKANGLRNANFQIAASLQGHRYSLLFTPENTDKVPVHFTTEENGTFTLTWNTQNGNFTSLLLVDNKTGNITDMLTSDHYTFNASTNDYASRFYLTYACTGVEENNDGDGSFVFFDGSQWVVDGQGFMDVVDMLGRTVYTERLVNEHNRVNLNGVVPGVYLMRVSDGKNTMVQKIVVR